MKRLLLAAALVLFSLSGVKAQGPITHVSVGDYVPEFTVEMFDGKKIDITSLRGKVVLINFWATWCPPCREELKHVQTDIIDRFKDNDFVFIPISRGETRETVEEFRTKNGYTFPMGLDPKQKIFNLFASNAIPRNFVIGKDGKIVASEIGFDPEEFKGLIEEIQKLF